MTSSAVEGGRCLDTRTQTAETPIAHEQHTQRLSATLRPDVDDLTQNCTIPIATGQQAAPAATDHDGDHEDVRACLFRLLQQKSPGQTITVNALGMLESLLDSVSTVRPEVVQ